MATDKRIFYSMLGNYVFDKHFEIVLQCQNVIVVHRIFGAFGRPHYKGRLAKSLAHDLAQPYQRVTPEGIGARERVLHWV